MSTKRPPGKLIHIVMRLLAALALSTGRQGLRASFRGPRKLPVAELAYGGKSGRCAYRHGCLG
jgi:hypothetical protein